ncbi:hypothetical protein [Lysinibacillus xylanilyticus]|uniref:hypothetical protein n=1 Tax=Lysinibacillus xylanilyticus TaxID=582475 RepID=UPI0036DB02F4
MSVEKWNEDPRIIRNVTSVMLIVYLVSFIAAVNASVNKNKITSIWVGLVFLISLLVLFYTTNSYYKTRLEDNKNKSIKLNLFDYSAYLIKELFSIFTAFLITIIYISYDSNLNPYIFIGTSLLVALVSLIIFYLCEKCWCKGIFEFRKILDDRYNITNIVNIFTGICTLFVFIADMRKLDSVIIFCVLAIVYTYYVFYNFIYIKK